MKKNKLKQIKKQHTTTTPKQTNKEQIKQNKLNENTNKTIHKSKKPKQF